MLLLLGTALATAVVAAEPLAPGMTFGTGIAGIPICQEPRVVVNYTLSSGSSHGVLHHFVSVHALNERPHCSTCPSAECTQSVDTARSSPASLSAIVWLL
jgi:hypothetical protein